MGDIPDTKHIPEKHFGNYLTKAQGWRCVPVETGDELSCVVRQDDPVLTHVPLVPQHTYGHVRGHLGQLPHDVIEGPVENNTPVISCILFPFSLASVPRLSPSASFTNFREVTTNTNRQLPLPSCAYCSNLDQRHSSTWCTAIGLAFAGCWRQQLVTVNSDKAIISLAS